MFDRGRKLLTNSDPAALALVGFAQWGEKTEQNYLMIPIRSSSGLDLPLEICQTVRLVATVILEPRKPSETKNGFPFALLLNFQCQGGVANEKVVKKWGFEAICHCASRRARLALFSSPTMTLWSVRFDLFAAFRINVKFFECPYDGWSSCSHEEWLFSILHRVRFPQGSTWGMSSLSTWCRSAPHLSYLHRFPLLPRNSDRNVLVQVRSQGRRISFSKASCWLLVQTKGWFYAFVNAKGLLLLQSLL